MANIKLTKQTQLRKNVLYKYGIMLYIISLVQSGKANDLSNNEINALIDTERFFSDCFMSGVGRTTRKNWWVLKCEDGGEISFKFNRGNFHLRSNGTLIYQRIGSMVGVLGVDRQIEVETRVVQVKIAKHMIRGSEG